MKSAPLILLVAVGACHKRAPLPLERPDQQIGHVNPEADAVVTPVTAYDADIEAEIDAVISDLRAPGVLAGELGPPHPLAERMEFYDVPGVSIAVIDGYAVSWARGFGVRRHGDDTPVDVDTLFEAGSISKAVFATAVMRLRDAGRVDLDRDVNTTLESWRLPPSAGWQPTVTLRQLLTHSAGLTVHGFPGYEPGDELPTVEQILDGEPPANTPPVRVDIVPGLQPRYSGGGITVAQLLVTDVLDVPFEQAMQTWALEPMGMLHSTYAQPLPRELAPRAATGHTVHNHHVRGGFSAYPEQAAAGLWTTPTDLARFALGLMLSYRGDDDAPLPQATAAEIMTPQTAPDIGIGVFLAGEGDATRFFHGGVDAGFEADLVAYPHRGQGAVVMTNANFSGELRQEILAAIARVYDWPDYVEGPPTRVVEVDAKTLARYAGRYQVRDGYVVDVAVDGAGLAVTFPGQAPLSFQPTSPTEFFTNALDVTIAFEVDDQGPARTLVVVQGRGRGRSKIPAARVVAATAETRSGGRRR